MNILSRLNLLWHHYSPALEYEFFKYELNCTQCIKWKRPSYHQTVFCTLEQSINQNILNIQTNNIYVEFLTNPSTPFSLCR